MEQSNQMHSISFGNRQGFLRKFANKLAESFRRFINSFKTEEMPIDESVSSKAAKIRDEQGISIADQKIIRLAGELRNFRHREFLEDMAELESR